LKVAVLAYVGLTRRSIKFLVTAFSNSRFIPMVARPFKNSGVLSFFGMCT
jgi:hypothetical protein